ncbi:Ig-like domain-containing protein [Geodermatophilus sp. SYSU D00710]
MESTRGRQAVGLRRRLLVAVVLAVACSMLASPPAHAEVGVPVTYVDHAFASGVSRPSQDKPQSKLWFHDGAWWALMVQAGGTQVRVHELLPDHTWRDTGTVIDSRANSTGDAMWSARDGKLWVASRASGSNLAVSRSSYDSATRSWTVDAGFPLSLNTGGGSESATIDQDSLGRLWVTYTRGSRVWVAHSSDSTGASWTAPFQPAVPDTVISADDLSALIAFGDSVGVMWSDQQSGAFRFAIHDNAAPDNVWRVEDALTGTAVADDHINLKQLIGDPQGRIFAAVKTSAGDAAGAAPGDTLVGVLTRVPGPGGVGQWSLAPAGTVGDDHSRPIIAIDATNQELYFLATAPGNGGDVFYKKAPLSNVSFPAGRGQRFVDAPFAVNDPAGAKDPITAQTGLVVIASSSAQLRYVHAEMQLVGAVDTSAPTVTSRSPAVDATGVSGTANVTATFSEPVQGVEAATFTLTDPAGAVVPAVVSRNGTTNQWILNPNPTLALGTRYTVTLTGGATAIRDAVGNPLTTVSWSFTTLADTSAPTVTSRSPAVDATGVSGTANVTATFSEPVQGVEAATFTLTDPAGAVVPAVVSRNGTTNQWILNPNPTLALGTRYTVTLTGGATAIRDAAGNPLTTVSWSFTTLADTSAPTVTSRSPAVDATNIGTATTNVTATFSEAVQGVEAATFTLTDPAGAVVPATVFRNGTTNQWVLDPAASLVRDTRYTVTLTGGPNAIRDLGGNPLAPVTWSFTTGPPPTVSTRTPAANATGVAVTSTVTATFSEAVQNVTATSFTLTDPTGVVVPAQVARNGTTNQWVLDPDADLTANTRFTVTVVGGADGVEDLAGNPLVSNVTWTFTTAP